MGEVITIKIGDEHREGGQETIRLEKWRGLKAFEIIDTLTELGEKVPNLDMAIGEYRRSYRAANFIEIPRETAEYRDPERASQVSEEAWKASVTKDGHQVLRMPSSPSFEQIVLAVFPTIYRAARETVQKLLVIAVSTNKEIEDAEEADNLGGVDEETGAWTEGFYKEKRAWLLRTAEYTDLIVIASKIVDQIRTELADYKDDLGNLRSLWPEEESEAPTPELTPDPFEEIPDSPNGAQTASPSSSPPPGDGTDAPPSTIASGSSAPGSES